MVKGMNACMYVSPSKVPCLDFAFARVQDRDWRLGRPGETLCM
jgi:hypothetical protein